MKVKVYQKLMGNDPQKVKRVCPEYRYRVLMEMNHESTSKNVSIFPRQLSFTTAEVKYFCLMLHPIQVQKSFAYRRQQFLPLMINSGRLSLIWIHILSSICKMNHLKTILPFLLCLKIEKLHINLN